MSASRQISLLSKAFNPDSLDTPMDKQGSFILNPLDVLGKFSNVLKLVNPRLVTFTKNMSVKSLYVGNICLYVGGRLTSEPKELIINNPTTN